MAEARDDSTSSSSSVAAAGDSAAGPVSDNIVLHNEHLAAPVSLSRIAFCL